MIELVPDKGGSGQMALRIEGEVFDVGEMRQQVSKEGFEGRRLGLPRIPRWFHGSLMGRHERLDEIFCRDMHIA